MNPHRHFIGMGMILLFGAAAAVRGQDLINRRGQAQSAVRATPERLYGHYCAHCHGEDGKGEGRLWVSELSPKPSDLSATKMGRDALFQFIAKGSLASGRSSFCPPWERTLSVPSRRRLVRFLLAMKKDKKAPTERPAPAPTAAGESGEPFPWLPVLIIGAELILLAWFLQRRRNVVKGAA